MIFFTLLTPYIDFQRNRSVFDLIASKHNPDVIFEKTRQIPVKYKQNSKIAAAQAHEAMIKKTNNSILGKMLLKFSGPDTPKLLANNMPDIKFTYKTAITVNSRPKADRDFMKTVKFFDTL